MENSSCSFMVLMDASHHMKSFRSLYDSAWPRISTWYAESIWPTGLQSDPEQCGIRHFQLPRTQCLNLLFTFGNAPSKSQDFLPEWYVQWQCTAGPHPNTSTIRPLPSNQAMSIKVQPHSHLALSLATSNMGADTSKPNSKHALRQYEDDEGKE